MDLGSEARNICNAINSASIWLHIKSTYILSRMKTLLPLIVLWLVLHAVSGQHLAWFRKETLCEHSVLSISCPLGTGISVVSAFYGRISQDICPSSSSNLTTICKATLASNKVRATCNGNPSCRISASNRLFGDPCYGVFKYLTVAYFCKTFLPPAKIACENSLLKISCPSSSVIRITYVSYGRLSTRICPGSNSHHTTCSASSSLPTVRSICDKRPECSIFASNQVFGDPCSSVYKYLVVGYSCVRPRRRFAKIR